MQKFGDGRVALIGEYIQMILELAIMSLALLDFQNADGWCEPADVGDDCFIPAGFPSVGKSTLLTQLTGTSSEAAAYVRFDLLHDFIRIQILYRCSMNATHDACARGAQAYL